MKIKHIHKWDVAPKEGIVIQKSLMNTVIYDRPVDVNTVRLVGGVDVSVKNGMSQAAVVVMTFPELQVIETALAKQPTSFPYVPGLLSFREGPVLVEAFEKLQNVPDVFIFDGMGRIHPRRMGIASHMGLWLAKATIGCGKTHFIGEYDLPGKTKGDYSYLTDKGETLGVVLRSRDKVKPVYISAGHMIDLDSAVEIVMMCTPKYRLPEPIRQAHKAAGDL
jgi:deoxyribonuclease V